MDDLDQVLEAVIRIEGRYGRADGLSDIEKDSLLVARALTRLAADFAVHVAHTKKNAN